ncbi:MAG: glycoside hydrolase family 32 protein [Myxococcales bacterium]|nr:glycoside hydrolase family 32 protein [Myxococcales bacterium]
MARAEPRRRRDGRSTRALALAASLALTACGDGPGGRAVIAADPGPLPPPVYPETWRPQFHFTPERNWMNDPNGLVYYQGEYHLFYQFEPDRPILLFMHWGHAVSRDLAHWEHLPIALRPTLADGLVFSGSAVVDRANTSGLCEGADPADPSCLVAIFTHFGPPGLTQKQSVAVSQDRGRTWELYPGNPVLPNPGTPDFRDPKVFWHAPTARWIMVLAVGDHVEFYGSANLLDWTDLSAFGPAGVTDGLWECPDLFELPVAGAPGETRWILQVDYNPGFLAGFSGGQYFVGDFDGATFTPEHTDIRRVDGGADFYAAQSWSDAPGGRRIWIAWMSDWRYALAVPTTPWRGAMTIPREVGLARRDGHTVLVQQPAAELKALRHRRIASERNRRVEDRSSLLDGIQGDTLEIVAAIRPEGATRVGLRVRVGEGEATTIGYDVSAGRLYVDRRNAGTSAFNPAFAARHEALMPLRDGLLDLRVFVDWSSVEVFADGGAVVLTDLIFPSPESRGLELFSEGGAATVVSVEVHEVASIWRGSEASASGRRPTGPRP